MSDITPRSLSDVLIRPHVLGLYRSLCKQHGVPAEGEVVRELPSGRLEITHPSNFSMYADPGQWSWLPRRAASA